MVQTEVHEVTREYLQDVVPPGLWLQLVIDSIAFDCSGLLIMLYDIVPRGLGLWL